MSDLNFNIFTEKDKENISYGACLGGSALTGMAVGRFVGVQGIIVGGIAGLAIGLMTCQRLTPAIKQKLFSVHTRLSDRELLQALQAVREQKPGIGKSEAMDLFAAARSEIFRSPSRYNSCHA
jgi:hypothetical protein